MNSTARSELIAQLDHLLEKGDSMSMLVITVRNTSNGILAGLRSGLISLDYPKAGWLDIVRTCRFKAFCKSRGFEMQCTRWGREQVIRANIGSDSRQAADIIDACFGVVHGECGQFGLELRGFGWQPE
jgi:hypothetical protein